MAKEMAIEMPQESLEKMAQESLETVPEDCLATSSYYRTCGLPPRFEYPHVFQHYGCQLPKRHPMYRTTSMAYGFSPPTVHTVPRAYFPKKNEFTKTRGTMKQRICILNM